MKLHITIISRRPDLSKLHVFGTICYPYIEEYKKKLDPRSSEGIFVGYDKNSPAYLIYYPNSNIVRRHRTVKFTDKFKNTHDKQIPNNHISGEFENDATVQNELSINGIETQIDDIHTGKQSDDDIDELSINEIETQKNDYHTGKQSDDDIDELSINEIETQKNDYHTGKQSDVDIDELSINEIETQKNDYHTGKQSDDDIDELSINEIETQKNDYHTGKQSDDDIDELSINEIETQKNDNHTGKQSDVDIEDERKEARGKLINKVRKLPPRSRNLPKHLNDYACSNIDFCYKVMNVPKTYKEALETSDTNESEKGNE